MIAAIAVTVAAVVVGWRIYDREPDAGTGPDRRPRPRLRLAVRRPRHPDAGRLPPAPPTARATGSRYERRGRPDDVAARRPVRPGAHLGTFDVGELDTVVAGHLLTVDSDRVRDQVAADCPDLFDGLRRRRRVEHQRLSMLRPVWFSPTVEQSDRGPTWYRCDAIAVESEGRRWRPSAAGSRVCSDRAGGLATYGVCGTAEPGDRRLRAGRLRREHTWEAIDTVDVPGDVLPRQRAGRARRGQPCMDPARGGADDALTFEWGFEWPHRSSSGAPGGRYGSAGRPTDPEAGQKPSRRSWRGSRCQSLAILTRRSR